eukprot:3094737-Amphidinium_carterae.1
MAPFDMVAEHKFRGVIPRTPTLMRLKTKSGLHQLPPGKISTESTPSHFMDCCDQLKRGHGSTES